jgi:hypothetical protein
MWSQVLRRLRGVRRNEEGTALTQCLLPRSLEMEVNAHQFRAYEE